MDGLRYCYRIKSKVKNKVFQTNSRYLNLDLSNLIVAHIQSAISPTDFHFPSNPMIKTIKGKHIYTENNFFFMPLLN